MAVKKISAEEFEQEVLQAGRKVFLDCYADWCGPCRMVSPTVEELSQEAPDVKFCKLNVDEAPELAARYGVMSIPTFLVFENGEVVKQGVGAQPKSGLALLLQ